MNQDNLVKTAIDSAIRGNWEKARGANLEIIKRFPQDIQALNRLARAFMNLGDVKQAKKISKEVLVLDPYNKIAQKALDRYKAVNNSKTWGHEKVYVNLFLEEPGKTTTADLVYLGDKNLLSQLEPGDQIELTLRKKRMSVFYHGNYIGRLTDDLSARMKELIEFGNSYQIIVKSASPVQVKIFIKELTRSKKMGATSSFPKSALQIFRLSQSL